MRHYLLASILMALMGMALGGLTVLSDRCALDTWRGGVVLLCRATEPIRVWTLPVVQPWYEDPWKPGRIADG